MLTNASWTEKLKYIESIVLINKDRSEFCYGRDLMSPLGYGYWQALCDTIEKARIDVEIAFGDADQHFIAARTRNKSSGRQNNDCKLSMLAAYYVSLHSGDRGQQWGEACKEVFFQRLGEFSKRVPSLPQRDGQSPPEFIEQLTIEPPAKERPQGVSHPTEPDTVATMSLELKLQQERNIGLHLESELMLRRQQILEIYGEAGLAPIHGLATESGTKTLPPPAKQGNSLFLIQPYWMGNTWVFDVHALGLYAEPFVAGADEILTGLVVSQLGLAAAPGSKFNLFFSAERFPGCEVSFTREDPEHGGYWYSVDNDPLDSRGWLCPSTLRFFPDGHPEKLHIQLTHA